MFDIGFTELVVIGVVALVVLGPERLPKVARLAGHLFGRFQRYVANVKADIQREMDAAELGKLKTEVQDAARAFEHSVNEQVQSVQTEAQSLEHSVNEALHPGESPAQAEAGAAVPPPALDEPARQLDLGIGGEPPSEPALQPTTQQKLVN